MVPGDRVAWSPRPGSNGSSATSASCWRAGVTVPIYASNTAEQCEFIVRDAGAKVVMVEDDTQRDKIMSLRDRLLTVTGARPDRGRCRRAVNLVQTLAELRAAGPRGLAGRPAELDQTRRDRARVDLHHHLHVGDDRHAERRGPHSRPSGGRLQRRTGHGRSSTATSSTCSCRSRTCSGARSSGRAIQLGCETVFSRGICPDQRGSAGGATDVHGRRSAHLREVLRRA